MDADAQRPVHGPTLEDGVRLLRAERAGALSFDEEIRRIKFVTDNATGHIIAPVSAAALESFEHVLYIPEESDDALQLLLTPVAIDPDRDAGADRWRIYHGEPDEARWARFHIELAKFAPRVFDGDAFMTPNPLGPCEPALCRALNADREKLRRMCQKHAGVAVAEPTCVGADPDGLHIRARFGIVRVPFAQRLDSCDAAQRAVESMLRNAGA